MKRSVYYRGVPGKKYGIWNGMAKCFQFNICEDTPMLAEALTIRLEPFLHTLCRNGRYACRQHCKHAN